MSLYVCEGLESREQETETVSGEQLKLQRCRFLLSHALDADEAGDKEAAVQLYTQAVEFSLTAVHNHYYFVHLSLL